jgi:hypothetical protein
MIKRMVTNNSFSDLWQFLPYYQQFHEHENFVTCTETARVCIITLSLKNLSAKEKLLIVVHMGMKWNLFHNVGNDSHFTRKYYKR